MPAAASPPTAAPATPPAPTNPESKQTIVVAPPTSSSPPPKTGSIREQMFKDLEKRGKPATGHQPQTDEPPAPAAPPAPADKPVDEPPAEPVEGQPATQPATGKTAEPGKKVSPWKLVDEYKAKTAALEKQLAEKHTLPEQEKIEYVEKLKAAEERNKELENEMRFVNYRKSAEFKKTYLEPYDRAWTTAMKDLGELTVAGPGGNARPLKAEDILELVNLPLPKARELAEQAFGNFADDVMAHRKTIKHLWDAQAAALEEAHKGGEAREKEMTERFQAENGKVRKFVSETWTAANEAATKDPQYGQYFTPKEGDQEWNQRLAKGFELVDRAFKESPTAPGITEQDRAAIVKRHSAVRNRAASWGALRFDNERLKSTIASLQKELEEIKGSAPTTGGDSPSSSGAQPLTARAQMEEKLRKMAKTV